METPIHSMATPDIVDADKLGDRTQAPALSWTVAAIGAFGLIFNTCAIFVGFHHTLYDFYGFRQTQTAISVESLLHGGSFLRYETPTMGPPWAVPLEFPLYQGIVAGVIKLLGTPIEETGRAVSILFLYLCVFPVASILHRLRLRKIHIIAILAILLVTPLYILVSRTFMIESTALFFSLMYAEQMFQLTIGARPWQYRHMIGAAVFGMLGGMVKVTTFAPYFVLGAGLAAWQVWKLHRSGTVRLSRIGTAAILSGLLPVALTLLWTKFADNVKAQNPIGVNLISTNKAMKVWNFGTIAQRLHIHAYHVLGSGIDSQIGYPVVAVVIVGVYGGMLIAVEDARPFWRWNRIAAICVALYAGTVMLFFNLHVVHEYYPYSIALFLVVAIGALIAPMLDLPGGRAWAGVALLAMEMLACILFYVRNYYPIQSLDAPGRPVASAIVDRTTRAQSVILVTGLSGSSEFPYQSQRRAIADPAFSLDGHEYSLDPSVMRQAVENVGPDGIAAVIACDAGRNSDRLKMLLHIAGMGETTEFHGDDCDIYERAGGQSSPEQH
jgi:hypothetical protein